MIASHAFHSKLASAFATTILWLTFLSLAGVCFYWYAFKRRENSVTDTATPVQTTWGKIPFILSPSNRSPEFLLASRALANRRLRNAFGLSNTFVSNSPVVHDAFKTHTRRLLRDADHWKDLKSHAVEAVDFELFQPRSPSAPLPYETFIQCVALRVVLVSLLHVRSSVDAFDHESIAEIAKSISFLWGLSKSTAPEDKARMTALRESLVKRLDDIGLPTTPVPDGEAPNFEHPSNPLDLIIPSWETLWRVVAIAFARVSGDDGARFALDALFCSPDAKTFSYFAKGQEGAGPSPDATPAPQTSSSAQISDRGESELWYVPSVNSIVRETMRLHPPVKHIHRAVPFDTPFPSGPWPTVPFLSPSPSPSPSPALSADDTALFDAGYYHVHADIEAAQRDESVWGADAGTFDPMRHRHATARQRETLLLVFGAQPFRCIATQWAPMAVGIILAAIADVVGADGPAAGNTVSPNGVGKSKRYVLQRGPELGGREGWVGWVIREEVESFIP